MRTYEIFCGNFRCVSRRDGRMFKVVDVDGMTAGERSRLVRPGASSDDELIDGIDGLMTDGETWVCANCREAAS